MYSLPGGNLHIKRTLLVPPPLRVMIDIYVGGGVVELSKFNGPFLRTQDSTKGEGGMGSLA